jgi:hypothetical protein
MQATECRQCQDGRGTIQNGSAFCSPCAKGRKSSIAETKGLCVDCPKNMYQDKEEQKLCLPCPTGRFAAEKGSAKCVLPGVDESQFGIPAHVGLHRPSNDAAEEHVLVLRWTLPTHDAETGTLFNVPDGFDVRISSSREFPPGPKTTVLPNRVLGSGTRETRVEFPDPSTVAMFAAAGIAVGRIAPWMLSQQTFMQVRAFNHTTQVVGKWSNPTEAWITADQCEDKTEFLEVNGTKNEGLDPSEWRCRPCSAGASCAGPTIWRDVRPLDGYWRIPWSARGSIFERCPYPADCRGVDEEREKRLKLERARNGTAATTNSQNATSTTDVDGCIPGTMGLLCSICEPGYNRDALTCRKCENETLGGRIAILVAGGLFCVGLLAFFRKRLATKWRRYRPLYRDVLRIFAIIVTFQQINTSITTIIEIPWPPFFTQFVAHFAIVNIDMFSLVGVGCVGQFDFMMAFMGMLGLPISILAWSALNLFFSRKVMLSRMAKMTPAEKDIQEEDALHQLFHIADEDGGGHICASELAVLLRQLGWHVNAHDARDVIQHFIDSGGKDWADKHGRVVLDEGTFVASMLSGKMSAILKKKQTSLRKSTTGRRGSFSAKSGRLEEAALEGLDKLKKDAEADAPGELKNIEVHESLLCDRDHLIRWILGKRMFADAMAGGTALLMLAHTPVSRKVFQVSGVFIQYCSEIPPQYAHAPALVCHTNLLLTISFVPPPAPPHTHTRTLPPSLFVLLPVFPLQRSGGPIISVCRLHHRVLIR